MTQSRETLLAAKNLQQAGLLRDAVNRGYYAMFYAGMALLASKALGTSKHAGLISMFGQHFVKTGLFSEEAGRHLRQAFELRQECDYESFVEPTVDQTIEVVTKAEYFIGEAERVWSSLKASS